MPKTGPTVFNLNKSVNDQNSGIEFAEFQRFNVFRRGNIPFKLVLIDWNQNLHKIIKRLGLADNEVANLFDFYQMSENIPTKELKKEDLDYATPNTVSFERDSANSWYVRDDVTHFILGKVQTNLESDDVEIFMKFDQHGNTLTNSFYDSRGFESLRQYLSTNGLVCSEKWFTPEGKSYLQTYNRSIFDRHGNKTVTKTGWTLTDPYDNYRTYSFSDFSELQTKFYDDLNKREFDGEHQNIIVIDRGDETQDQVLNMKTDTFKIYHLHNSQAGDVEQETYSLPNNHYEKMMNQIDEYDMILSATHKQANDFKFRVHPDHAEIKVVPVGVVDDELLHREKTPMADRKRHSIVVTARHSYEKHIEDMIEAASIVKEKFPDVHLDTYGYFDDNNNKLSRKAINQAVKDHDMKDNITIHGYTDKSLEVKERNQVYLVTSSMEGFNIALMEALATGNVAVSYDVNYGPSELIVDGENGYLVKTNDVQALADKIVTLFEDDDKLQQMSDNAIKLSERFSEESILKLWHEIIDESEKARFSKLALADKQTSY